jgi:hypothetical protein
VGKYTNKILEDMGPTLDHPKKDIRTGYIAD